MSNKEILVIKKEKSIKTQKKENAKKTSATQDEKLDYIIELLESMKGVK